jgi:hypothetical protein
MQKIVPFLVPLRETQIRGMEREAVARIACAHSGLIDGLL